MKFTDAERKEAIEYWHIARVAGFESRYDRMQYVKREFSKVHSGWGPKQLWLEIEVAIS